jgi:hypothetical protein
LPFVDAVETRLGVFSVGRQGHYRVHGEKLLVSLLRGGVRVRGAAAAQRQESFAPPRQQCNSIFLIKIFMGQIIAYGFRAYAQSKTELILSGKPFVLDNLCKKTLKYILKFMKSCSVFSA